MDILFKKMVANFIDLIASFLIRVIILSLVIIFYKHEITAEINHFSIQIGNVASDNPNELLRLQIITFIQHNLFKISFLTIISFSFLGLLYNIYFHSSTWCATIGQRICNIVVVKNNSEYVGFFRAVIHNIISNIPLFITLYFIIFTIIHYNKYIGNNSYSIINIFTANNFNILISIIMFLWITTPTFLKNRKSIPDILCNIKTELGRTDSKFPKIRI